MKVVEGNFQTPKPEEHMGQALSKVIEDMEFTSVEKGDFVLIVSTPDGLSISTNGISGGMTNALVDIAKDIILREVLMVAPDTEE